MKRTALKRKTPLRRSRRPINKISHKMYDQLIAEVPIRKALCYRCSGKPIETIVTIGFGDGTKKYLPMIRCQGGYCETCGKRADFIGLKPHHKIFRSRGGRLTLENSLMDCHRYHSGFHGIKVVDSQPQWSKK